MRLKVKKLRNWWSVTDPAGWSIENFPDWGMAFRYALHLVEGAKCAQ